MFQTMLWNPHQYLRFAGERRRPGLDLLAQLGDLPPGPIYDLGCGTGAHTSDLAARWPGRPVTGIDNSPDMLAAAATASSSIRWVEADINRWQLPEKAALIYSNATFQWLGDHAHLFPRLLAALVPGGVLAVQMPRNFANLSQVLLREIASKGPWARQLAPLFDPKSDIPSLLRPDPVGTPEFYYDLLAPRARNGLDLWETEYVHQLEGEEAVFEWMRGTTLRPLLAALDERMQAALLAAYAAELRAIFPRHANGKTLLHFRRLFLVAVA